MASSAPPTSFRMEFLVNAPPPSIVTRKITDIQLLSWSGPLHSNFKITPRIDKDEVSGNIRLEYKGLTSMTITIRMHMRSPNDQIQEIDINIPQVTFDQDNTTFVTPPIPVWPWEKYSNNKYYGYGKIEPDNYFTVSLVCVVKKNSTVAAPDIKEMVKEIIQDSDSSLIGSSLNFLTLREGTADVVLKLADGQTLKANKIILMGRSDYFRQMFEYGAEVQEGTMISLQVPDITKDVMDLVLRFIYAGGSGVVEEIRERDVKASFALFKAAEKMGLEQLKSLVAMILVEKTGTERGIGFLVLQFLNDHHLPNLAAMVEANLAHLLQK